MEKNQIHYQKIVPSYNKNSNTTTKIQAKLETLRRALSGNSSTNNSHQSTKIQKIPLMLRDNKNFKTYCHPRFVSIGPIHHGNEKLKACEYLKLKLAALFIEENKIDDRALFNDILDRTDYLKSCYNEEDMSKENNIEFAWMLLVDGCTILQYMNYAADKKLNELKIRHDQVAFAHYDLFLLENQLPNQLLQLLIDSCREEGRRRVLSESIYKFIDMNIEATTGVIAERKQSNRLRSLLDLVRNIFTHSGCRNNDIKQSAPSPAVQVAKAEEQKGKPPAHLLELFRDRFIGKIKEGNDVVVHPEDIPSTARALKAKEEKTKSNYGLPISQHKNEGQNCGIDKVQGAEVSTDDHRSRIEGKDDLSKKARGWYSYRNVNQLKSAGIMMKYERGGSIRDIKFDNGFLVGTLTLPSLVVNDYTAPRFLNMIALEMCHDFQNEFEVTSYICFLDSLIDRPEDVKHLREAQVLQNNLGSDDEVADLFNQINTGLAPNPEIYCEVKYKLQNYYETKWRTWIAVFYHDHFNTPWSALAFGGALYALALASIQTWFTVYPRE